MKIVQVDNSFKMVAKTLFGFEEVLAQELRNIGATKVNIGNRMVSFYGDTGFMYKANLCVRTAIKILKPITSGNVRNESDLYNFIQSIAWEEYLDVEDTFAIHATVNSKAFTHSHFISLKTNDAIVDKFRKNRVEPNHFL